jgi:fatty acid desaturase
MCSPSARNEERGYLVAVLKALVGISGTRREWFFTSLLCEDNLAEDRRTIHGTRRSIAIVVVAIVVVDVKIAATFSIAIWAVVFLVVVVVVVVVTVVVIVVVHIVTNVVPELKDLAQTGSSQHAARRKVYACQQSLYY